VNEDVHATITSWLRRVDQRYTTGRRRLVEALAAAAHPVTTAELVQAQPGMPQSTAYRNLAVLAQAGVVHRVVGSDEYARYELAEELTGRHHHHLVCQSCGAVDDFTPSAAFERSINSLIGALGAKGFQVETHRLDLLGTCARCAN
jgi:Fur family transcriptional regulator, ferric uptake regulator